jgi:threonine dehydrogenase-like Zn-dependent dehydrogenase
VLGGIVGTLGAAQVVRGALRRGGTRGGTALLVGAGAVGVAALAWVPVLGYVEALALPWLAARIRKRSPERYAGLRSLARD